jgi:hypothetical protein
MEDELRKQIEDIVDLVGLVEEDAFGCFNYIEIKERVRTKIIDLVRKIQYDSFGH